MEGVSQGASHPSLSSRTTTACPAQGAASVPLLYGFRQVQGPTWASPTPKQQEAQVETRFPATPTQVPLTACLPTSAVAGGEETQHPGWGLWGLGVRLGGLTQL